MEESTQEAAKEKGKRRAPYRNWRSRSEPMVKVIKKKAVPAAAGSSKGGGRGKSSGKVKVTKAPPKLIHYLSLMRKPRLQELGVRERSKRGTTPTRSEQIMIKTERDLA